MSCLEEGWILDLFGLRHVSHVKPFHTILFLGCPLHACWVFFHKGMLSWHWKGSKPCPTVFVSEAEGPHLGMGPNCVIT
jgi:hypothetical protein